MVKMVWKLFEVRDLTWRRKKSRFMPSDRGTFQDIFWQMNLLENCITPKWGTTFNFRHILMFKMV